MTVCIYIYMYIYICIHMYIYMQRDICLLVVKATHIDYCDHGVDHDSSESSTTYVLLQGPWWTSWKAWLIGGSSLPHKCSIATNITQTYLSKSTSQRLILPGVSLLLGSNVSNPLILAAAHGFIQFVPSSVWPLRLTYASRPQIGHQQTHQWLVIWGSETSQMLRVNKIEPELHM